MSGPDESGRQSAVSEPGQVDYDVHLSSEQQYGGLMGPVLDVVQRAGSMAQLDAQGARLAEGLSTRAPVSLGEQNYLAFDHPTLKSYVTDQMDPAMADEAGAVYTDYGNFLNEMAADLEQATGLTASEWQGEAGAAMRAKMGTIAGWMSQTGQAGQAAGNGLGQQAMAADQARASMPEPVEYNPWAMLRDAALSPNPIDIITVGPEIINKRQEANEAHQRAAQVATTMDGGYREADAAMPMFAPAPELADVPPPGPPGGVPGGGGGGGGGAGVPLIGGGGGGGGAGVGSVIPAGVAPAAYVPPAGGDGTPGSPGGGTGGAVSTPGQSGVGVPGGVAGSSPSGAAGRPGSGGGFDGVGGVPVGGRVSSTGAGGGRAGLRGGGNAGGLGGRGIRGGVSGGGIGGGASGGGRATFGPSNPGGGRGAFGPSGPGGATAGAGGTSAATGGGRGGPGGLAGAPMGGAGRGRGEDSEHQRPGYLVETNPDAIVGEIAAVAPPVIGEDPDVYQRDR